MVLVVHHRVAQLAVAAVDPTDRFLHAGTGSLIAIDALPRRRSHLNQRRRFQPAFLQELLKRGQALQDALGVVKAVHPEHERVWVRHQSADLRNGGVVGFVELASVNRDRKGPRPRCSHIRVAAGKIQEVCFISAPLEADQVRCL